MIVDVHCHYTFSRLRRQATPRFSFEPPSLREPGSAAPHPDEFDSAISPRAEKRLAWRILRRMLGVPGALTAGPRLDAALERVYEQHLLAPGPIDRYVLLAFDAYHDNDGSRPPLPMTRRQRGSDIYSSNSLVAAACRARPERYLFGASVHPYRENAVACVDEVAAAGACLLKWLPLHQNIDVRDARSRAVLRRCAALRLPLLVHYSEEFTLATQHPEHRPLAPLLEVLRDLRREGQMPTTIVAHAATPVWPLGERRSHRLLLKALRGEFADAPLYADISALATLGKLGFLRRLAAAQDVHHKLLFGSDFPVPPIFGPLRRRFGRFAAQIRNETSWPQRMARAFSLLGFNAIVFHRAAEILRRP